MRITLTACFFLLLSIANAQYWFGSRFGISYIDHVYQDEDYEDDFDVQPNLNISAGAAFSYTASDLYAVYGELTYDRIGKSVKDITTDGSQVNTTMTNHFISAPVMLRINLGKVPFHYYLNGGPRISYWLAGSGTQLLAEIAENSANPEFPEESIIDYNIVFDREKVTSVDRNFVSRPNRVQFGLTVGGGVFFDMQDDSRLQIDFRYTWVHSNMGINNEEEDIGFVFESYRENFEYYHNIATIGVAYMWNYDAKLTRKGKSTNKESNKKKKKRKR